MHPVRPSYRSWSTVCKLLSRVLLSTFCHGWYEAREFHPRTATSNFQAARINWRGGGGGVVEENSRKRRVACHLWRSFTFIPKIYDTHLQREMNSQIGEIDVNKAWLGWQAGKQQQGDGNVKKICVQKFGLNWMVICWPSFRIVDRSWWGFIHSDAVRGIKMRIYRRGRATTQETDYDISRLITNIAVSSLDLVFVH